MIVDRSWVGQRTESREPLKTQKEPATALIPARRASKISSKEDKPPLAIMEQE